MSLLVVVSRSANKKAPMLWRLRRPGIGQQSLARGRLGKKEKGQSCARHRHRPYRPRLVRATSSLTLPRMKLNGVHHVTCITADAQRNVDFYVGTLGLRLVKRSVNQDDPSVYHLFYADEHGDPGSDLTFFEYKGAALGRPGAGMVHRICWRVASDAALEFWAARLGAAGVTVERSDGWLRFRDFEELEHELTVSDSADPPLSAEHPEIPVELALQGFDGVRAYAFDPEASRQLFEET